MASGLPQGKTMDFVDVNDSNTRWVQDFRLKAYASPAKLESIDGAEPGRALGVQFPLGPDCKLGTRVPGAFRGLPQSTVTIRAMSHPLARAPSSGGSWRAGRWLAGLGSLSWWGWQLAGSSREEPAAGLVICD